MQEGLARETSCNVISVVPLGSYYSSTEEMNGSDRPEDEPAAVRWTLRASSDDRRVGNVGVMLIEAAKQGSLDSLELLLELPQGSREIW